MKKSSGFTIVELLVVIVVIGILAAITIVSYTGISQKAIVASLQSDLVTASQQLKIYQVDKGVYPSTIDCSVSPPNYSICIKSSPGNTFDVNAYAVAVNNTANPQTFTLMASNTASTIKYYITNDTSPVLFFAAQPLITGGIVTYTDSSGLNPRASPSYSDGYTIHTFNSSGTLIVTNGCDAEILVIAGGGGGGASGLYYVGGGGGGSGGYLTGTETLIGNMEVTVGVGGSGGARNSSQRGFSGLDSVFGNFIAKGGGGGGNGSQYADHSGISGGSGGGAAANYFGAASGGLGTVGQGNNGGSGGAQYAGGGGGGAAAIGISGPLTGSTGANGGSGKLSSITGLDVYYAGGGGGANSGFGGLGGGGDGFESGSANTGGGGGGAYADLGAPGAGGSGIVIIRYHTY